MFGLGVTEIAIVGGILALLFGPSQLPRLGRSIGETIKEVRGIGKQLQGGDDERA